MRRRDFVAILGSAAAWPLAVRAQQARIPRIGIIDNTSMWDPFRQALNELGYVSGQSIGFEYRVAEGRPERLAAEIAELVRLPVDVIAVFGTPASLAAKKATAKIPIVMISIGDPVRAGLVPSLARPGGNITGNTILGPDIVAKRLQLVKELIPSVRRVAFLWNSDNASNVAQFEEVRVSAPVLDLTVTSVEVRRADEFENAFAAMMRERPDAFQMTNDPFQQRHIDWILEFLARNKVPGSFQTRDNVVAGGLLSYGASLPDLFRRGAVYVHRILQGTKPADLPVEQPVKFELVVNLKTAKALGLKLPESFLLRADEVIE